MFEENVNIVTDDQRVRPTQDLANQVEEPVAEQMIENGMSKNARIKKVTAKQKKDADREALKIEMNEIMQQIKVEDEGISKEEAAKAERSTAELAAIARSDASIVRRQINKGNLFRRLKEKAGRKWGKFLEEHGYHPRVASRYLKIAQAWGDEIGLIESDLLTKLPTDLLQLEVLAQLSLEQLEAFVTKNDAKKLGRSKVSRLVKEVTGKKAKASKRRPNAAKSIERVFDKVKEQLAEHPDDMELRDEVWQALQTHVKEVEVMLAADEAAPETDAAAEIESEAVADIKPEAVAEVEAAVEIEPEAVAEMEV